jgi:hypothetical protein
VLVLSPVHLARTGRSPSHAGNSLFHLQGDTNPMQRLLLISGLILLLLGLLWPLLSQLGLGRLPGDISIQREGFSFYFPITTSLLVSLVLSLVFWLVRR